jgi:hypothetical protein
MTPKTRSLLAATAVAGLFTACASLPPDEPPGAPMKHTVVAVTDDNRLLSFNAGTPRRIDREVRVAGLAAGETLIGIDYRVSRGVLFGLTSSGRLVTLDKDTGVATPVGNTPATPVVGRSIGFDVNPVADRIRVVTDNGVNLRLHPDTGALAATDPPLTHAASGAPASRVLAAGYTYNKTNDKLTTNYAIDAARGWLVTQGSIEGREPVVSPNTGRLFDVGALGTGPVDDVAFDIADTDNTALAALRRDGLTRLYRIDLATGQARLLGTVARGGALRGLAIEP